MTVKSFASFTFNLTNTQWPLLHRFPVFSAHTHKANKHCTVVQTTSDVKAVGHYKGLIVVVFHLIVGGSFIQPYYVAKVKVKSLDT